MHVKAIRGGVKRNMALNPTDRQLLKQIYGRLEDKPLQPHDEMYQPIYDNLGSDDPVELLQTHIEYTDVESIQMFSGFRGSGKTTELFRLKEALEKQHYMVLYADALDYVNPSEPIEISDLLIILAGAFSDALEQELHIDLADESYWTRFKNYLTRTEVTVTEATVKAEAANPLKEVVGGLKAGLDLKLALRTTPSFRQQLQQLLSARIGELKNNVNKFIEDGAKVIRRQRGDETQIVFLFDQLEQIRGSVYNEQDVIRSVTRVFANHLRMLELPYVHAVYTVPPWLQFVMPGIANIVMIPSIRQWNNDAQRSPYAAGWDALRELVHKRFRDEACERFFGPADADGHFALTDRLIGVCGGHFRDLLLLLRSAIVRTKSLPVPSDVINAAITSVRDNFLPIAIEDARWLHQNAQLRKAALPTANHEDVNRLTRFLDTYFVLYLTNGSEWYDIHPLIRDEVASIMQQHRQEATTDVATP
jgi:hypothetical protein